MSVDKITAKNPDPSTGTRLAIDIGTPMVTEIQGTDAKIKCIMVGMQVGEYLILRPPRSLAVKLFQIGRSPKAVVRYLFSGRVFGFESAMVGAILDPVGLIFLSYPKVVSEHNLRVAPRLECNLPVKITLNAVEISGFILDISPTGCRASITSEVLQASAVADRPVLESPIKINLQLPEETETLVLIGTIKNVEHDANRIAFGVAFKDIGDVARGQISHYLEEVS